MTLDKDDFKQIEKIIDTKVGKIVDEKVNKIVDTKIGKIVDEKVNHIVDTKVVKIVDDAVESLARMTARGFEANEKAHKQIREDIAVLGQKILYDEKRLSRVELKVGLRKS